ncbi:MAG: PspC domain-containing protein [Erysipelothrix sp.]|nr:PspC domain-containing protein [Erysipelothrix sp.]
MAYHSDNKLYRDKDGGMLGGVCAGLSEYFRIDVTIIRIIMAVLFFGYGSGLLLYILMWVIIPEKRDII